MSRYVSAELRREVAERAGFRCEYCRLPEAVAMVRFQIEHIIAIKHHGLTVSENLAYACPICNANKGTDIGTVLEDTETIIPFFNPRKHDWFAHFEVNNGEILPKTLLGEATVKILDFNTLERILERLELGVTGVYP
ncbi:MAG: HNH endonuclease [Saprospiraceae bacterium]